MIIFNHVFHESWLRMTFMVLLPGLVAVGATAQPAGVQLDTLTVKHIDFQGRTQEGVVICNHLIADDLRAIFEQLYVVLLLPCGGRQYQTVETRTGNGH